MRKEDFVAYIRDRRERAATGALGTSLSLDKALITLAAGAFGLSLLLLDRFGLAGGIQFILLVLSWLCFGAALVTTLLSLQKAAERLGEQTKYFDNISLALAAEAVDEKAREVSEKSYGMMKEALRLTRRYNNWSRALFMGGVVFMAAFAVVAASSQGGDMNEKRNPVGERGPEHAIPPRDYSKKGHVGDEVQDSLSPANILDNPALFESPPTPGTNPGDASEGAGDSVPKE